MSISCLRQKDKVIGILAALHNKHVTGLGQHVDISMLDVAVALLANQGMNYLAKKQRQKRVGNNHPNVVPYQVMPAKDGCSTLARHALSHGLLANMGMSERSDEPL